jgi:UDP-N-acetylglucosamine 2-epimerase (non-hydrolysing)
MKDVFFRQLDVPSPDFELGVVGESDAEFIGKWIHNLADLLGTVEPAAVAFLGDTNTVLGTIACASANIPVVHIEGCMRSYDWRMPEEKYRTVADHLSDVIYAYLDEYKNQGILEGLDPRQIVVTGNPIVDVLEHYFISGRLRMNQDDKSRLLKSVGLGGSGQGNYLVMTSHRRENVDSRFALQNILSLADAAQLPVVFPAGFRTQRCLKNFNIDIPPNVTLIDPIGYIELLELIDTSSAVLTDSGTVVEETSILGVPSIQMRSSTERPQVYDSGSSLKFDPHLSLSPMEMHQLCGKALSRRGIKWSHGLGDGSASQRIADDLMMRMDRPERFRGHQPEGTNKPFRRNLGFGIDDRGNWRI